MSDLEPPFTEAEAEKIVSRTKLISEGYGVWRVELASLSHAGLLVEATAEDDGQYSECLDKYDDLQPAKATANIEEIEHHTSSRGSEKDLRAFEDELENEHKVIEEAKEDLAREERVQIGKMGKITELKKELGHTLAELRKMETSLTLKREALKNMDRVYFGKLTDRENEDIAARKQAEEARSVGLAL